MKNAFKLFGVIAFVAIIGFSFAALSLTGCDNGGDDEVEKKPEDRPVKDRWGKWIADDSTATLVYSVDKDGICTITVGGTAQPNNESDGWGRWKAQAQYAYTAKAGKSYTYKFEAWTASGTRDLTFQYNTDNINEVYFTQLISLTDTRQAFTVNGQPLSKGVLNHIDFNCADQLGTFYIKILEIKESSSTNSGGKDVLDGTTWESNPVGYTLTFKSPNYTLTLGVSGGPQSGQRGTYSISGNNVTLISTDIDDWQMLGTLSGNTLSFTSSDGPTFTKK